MPAIDLAARLIETGLRQHARRLLHHRRRRVQRSRPSRRRASTGSSQGKPDKVKFISRVHGYHGVTMAAASATGMAAVPQDVRAAGAQLHPGRAAVSLPLGRLRRQGRRCRRSRPPRAVEEAILREGPETVAAVIAEPVMGAGGVIVPPDGYFPHLREICDRYDVLLIADEVITGFCRTGKWFALEHWNVQPDIVSFAKGVTSAYLPLGGIMLSERVHNAILDAPADLKFTHAATYSGHPTCCAVALRNIEILERREPGRARRDGRASACWTGLETLREYASRGRRARPGHDVRRRAGGGSRHARAGHRPGEQGRRRGAQARPLHAQPRRRQGEFPIGDTICLAPPLTTSDEQIDHIVSILHDAIRAATA